MPELPSHAPDSPEPSPGNADDRPCCYLCPSSSTVLCAQCQQPICPHHTQSHRDMQWDTFWAGGERVATTWTRYVSTPTGVSQAVCPACGEALAVTDAAEIAYDHAAMRQHVLLYLAVVGVLIVIAVWLTFLLGL